MTFDLHIQIDDQSPEGHVLETIMTHDHVSAEEAVRRALRRSAPTAPELGVQEDSVSPQSLADFLGDFVGSIQGSGADHSSNIGEEFGSYVVQKHREQRL
jgi:hypothetical protein